MADIDTIQVNGNQYSWGSIILKVGDDRLYGFTGISFGDKRTRVKAHGSDKSGAPRGRSRGKYETDEGKLTGWKSSIQALRAALAAQAADGVSYGNTEFNITVQYIEDDETPMTVELIRCTIAGDTTSDEEGPDPLKDEIGLDYMYVKRNGLTLFDNSDGYR